MINILIVDDHDLVREGVRALLEQDPTMHVVGEAGDGQQALRMVKELSPDVVLMDLSMPGGLGGLEATEAILSERPGVKILILTQYENREYIRRAIKVGAHGYLLKRSVAQQLRDAVRTVFQGSKYLHPRAAAELMELVTSGQQLDEDELENLTRRERQVFKLLAEGKTSREIAAYLNVSVKTAMTHREHVMGKLGVHSRADLVKQAIRRGVIQVEAETTT